MEGLKANQEMLNSFKLWLKKPTTKEETAFVEFVRQDSSLSQTQLGMAHVFYSLMQSEIYHSEFNRRIADRLDALLAEGGYSSDSSARNLLSMLNL